MYKSRNPVIEKSKKANHVANWELAERIGCHENTVIRLLRHPLPDEKTQELLNLIEDIAEHRNDQ